MLKDYFCEEEYEIVKKSDNILFKALEVVNRVFKDSVDKGGIPYSVHLLRVYGDVSDYTEKVCALLHDIVEDTKVSYDDLKDIGFNDEIIDIIKILTKLKGEDYQKYIDRIIESKNIHAYNIKIADLSHNMELGRIKNPTANDYERINKRYLPAQARLLIALEEME